MSSYETKNPASKDIAVLIPCFNESRTIAGVVEAFRAQLPDAAIYVYDNASTDSTAECAREAGAIVRFVERRGKGYVMRRMFQEVDADIYVMVDGDTTYPPERVHALIGPVAENQADMVVGSRLMSDTRHFKKLNLLGNRIFLNLIQGLFGVRITDLLSGYRAMNRRIVQAVPYLSRGFEIETELTIKALERDLRVSEVPVELTSRPDGSHSKIHILRDTLLILKSMFALARDYKPLTTFGGIGLIVILMGLLPGFVVIYEFNQTGLVTRLPLAVLSVGLVLSGLLSFFAGLLLHTVVRRFQELDQQIQQIMLNQKR